MLVYLALYIVSGQIPEVRKRDEGSWCGWMSFAGIDKGSQTMESLIVLSKQIFREVAGRILGVASIGNHGHF